MEQCQAYFTINPYATNETKAPGSTTYKLALVGSFTSSNMTEKVSMIKFAVDYLNNQTSILPSVNLELLGAEITGVKTNTVLAALAAVQQKARLIIGGTTEVETSSLYALSARYNLPQIAPFTNSDIYASPTAYPNLIDLSPSSQNQVSVLPGVIHHLGWSRCIVLVGDDQNGKNAYNYFTLSPYAKGYYNISYTIITAPAASSSDVATVRTLNNTMTQLFVVAMCIPTATVIRLMPLLYAAGLVTPKYSYIMCDQITQAIANNPGQFGSALKYMNGTIAYAPKALGFTPLYASMSDLWAAADPEKYPGLRPPSPSSWYGFEAVYMAAMAIDTLVGQGVNSDNITTLQMRNTLANANYEGVTGTVKFNQSGTIDRYGLWDVFNFYNNDLIYKFSMSNADPTIPYDVQEGNFTFFGGRTDIPEDYTRKIEYQPNDTDAPTAPPYVAPLVYRGYSVGLNAGFGAVAGVCICLAIFSVVVFIIKPQEYLVYGHFFTAVVHMGTFVSYAAGLTILPEKSEATCMAFPWLLGIGFNITFGILTLKICKLYNMSRGITRIKFDERQKSFSIVCFIIVDVVLLTIWTVVYPIKLKYVKMSDTTYELQCHNDAYIFWGIFLGYKALWVIAGTALSIVARRANATEETENIELKSIAHAIYNFMGMVIIGIPAGFGLSQVPQGTTIIIIAMIAFAFTFCLFILFFDIWYKIFFADKDIVGQASKSMEMAARKHGHSNGGGTYSINTGSKNSYSQHSYSNSKQSNNRSNKSGKTNSGKTNYGNSGNSGQSNSPAVYSGDESTDSS